MSDGEPRFVVFGAGALGSLLGGKLVGQRPVVLIGRGAHIAAIESNGLRIAGRSDTHLPYGDGLRGYCRLADMPPLHDGDMVLLTVKAAQLKDAVAELIGVQRGAKAVPVIAFQNGTGFEEDLHRATPHGFETMHAVSSLGATLAGPGVVEDWGGAILLPNTHAGSELRDALTAGGVDAQTAGDLEDRRWKKIAFNCVLNPFSALMAVRNRETIVDAFGPVRRAVLREVRTEAVDLGFRLPAVETLLAELDAMGRASNNVNSMLQDIQKGKPTEIRFLNRAIAELARGNGRVAPANACLANAVERLEDCRHDDERKRVRDAALEELAALAISERSR